MFVHDFESIRGPRCSTPSAAAATVPAAVPVLLCDCHCSCSEPGCREHGHFKYVHPGLFPRGVPGGIEVLMVQTDPDHHVVIAIRPGAYDMIKGLIAAG
jgi:hypothetical protein